MGKVFTWQELSERELPDRKSFERVADMLRHSLRKDVGVKCALLFGSVVRGDSNVRSDLDCLVMFDVHDEKRVMHMIDKITTYAQGLFVPLSIIPGDTTVASTHMHHFGPSFQEHLKQSAKAGGLIKGDLRSILAPSVDARQEIEGWLRWRMYNLQHMRTRRSAMSDDRFVSYLKKMSETALHTARKLLIAEGELDGDSKRDVFRRYTEVMPSHMSYLLGKLVALDSAYTAELAAQRREPSYDNHSLMLQRLEESYYEVCDFLRLNMQRLHMARA